jgi:hypothetical protein
MFIGLSSAQSHLSREAAAGSWVSHAGFLASPSEEPDLRRVKGFENNRSRAKLFNLFPGTDSLFPDTNSGTLQGIHSSQTRNRQGTLGDPCPT